MLKNAWPALRRFPSRLPRKAAVPSEPATNDEASGDWSRSTLGRASVRSTPGHRGFSESGVIVPQKTEYVPPGTKPLNLRRTSVRGFDLPLVRTAEVADAADHSPQVRSRPTPALLNSGADGSV